MARKPVEYETLRESRIKIAQITRDEKRYQGLGLSSNPFPAGLATSNPQIEPYPTIRTSILKFFERFLQTQKSKGLVLHGSYGAGKTYHITYIHNILESARYKIKIVHMIEPGIHPYHIIRRILLEIGKEEIAVMMWGLIGPFLRYELKNDPHFFDSMIRSTGSKKNVSVFQ